MHKQKVLLIGPCGGGSVPKNGASAKNYHLVKFLREKNVNIQTIDTENWRKNPFVLFRLAWKILFNPHSKFIVATNNMSSYRVMQIFSIFPRKRSVIYWIIGGSIANWIKDGKVKTAPFKVVEKFLAEGKKMQKTFADVGFENTIYVPNFKYIEYIPEKKQKEHHVVRFVFLSRIIPEKGCNTIIEAVSKLNAEYENRFVVDFFGPFEEEYESEFMSKTSTLENVHYIGFLDLRNQKNYDKLAEYDVMLFPTYWHGEGFPGIIIDAYVSGLPVIATDWSLNADIIEDEKTGVILKENTVDSLAEAMKRFIEHPSLLDEMILNCNKSAMDYDINNVLSADLFKQIGIEL